MVGFRVSMLNLTSRKMPFHPRILLLEQTLAEKGRLPLPPAAQQPGRVFLVSEPWILPEEWHLTASRCQGETRMTDDSRPLATFAHRRLLASPSQLSPVETREGGGGCRSGDVRALASESMLLLVRLSQIRSQDRHDPQQHQGTTPSGVSRRESRYMHDPGTQSVYDGRLHCHQELSESTYSPSVPGVLAKGATQAK